MAELKINKPQEKQEEFFRADVRYVCYGGARGGGKTWAARIKAVLAALTYKGIHILLMRRSFPEARNNFVLPLMLLLEKDSIAKYIKSDNCFYFKNGSIIQIGYCDNDSDAVRYQGQQFDMIFIDEATQFPEHWFIWISGACRGVNKFPKRIYLTCNPGGVGHEWVKRLFIDREFSETENPEDYLFIPAKATDNPALKESDPGYFRWLDSLPDGIREAWRDGNWDLFEGQYFSEFNRAIHVIEPFPIPAHWSRYVSMDYGFGDMCAVLWEAIDENGRVYVYREIYEKNLLPSEAARQIKEFSAGEKITDFLAPPDLFSKQRDGGRSVAAQFGENGLYLTQASNQRIAGWLAMKEQLKLVDTADGGKTSNMKIFTNCINLIKSIPKLQYDTKKMDGDTLDATTIHKYSHAPDALRYFCITHTAKTQPQPGKPPIQEFKYFPVADSEQEQLGSAVGYGETLFVV